MSCIGGGAMKKLCLYMLTLGLLVILSAGCESENVEQASVDGEVNVETENQAAIPNDNYEEEHEMIEFNFDVDNTVEVLREALSRADIKITERSAEDMLEPLRQARVRGVIRAEPRNTFAGRGLRSELPLLEIESEDNIIYNVYLMNRGAFGTEYSYFTVAEIYVAETNEILYHYDGLDNPGSFDGVPGPFENADFDVENSIRVIQEALGVDEQDARRPVARLALLGIKGIINAREVKDTTEIEGERIYEEGDRLFDFESEDNRHYRMWVNQRARIKRIIDLETGERVVR